MFFLLMLVLGLFLSCFFPLLFLRSKFKNEIYFVLVLFGLFFWFRVFFFVIVINLATIIQNGVGPQDSCTSQKGSRKHLRQCHLLACLSQTFHLGDRNAAHSVSAHGDYNFRSREDQDKCNFKFLSQETWRIQGFIQ